ncbi:hypothetical protein CNR22_01195 [Sphingobacteriaceae bacterium]|nr:hypothetical protein CNR22_01195 [Sphingobacteriaceae bacterium]
MEIETLIIDDDDIIVFIHERILIDCKFSVVPKSFHSAKQALNYMQTQPAKRYLIFLDINMPEMNGWEFMEALTAGDLDKQFAVLLVSSSVNVSDHEKSKNYPCVLNYIEKPLDKEKLQTMKESEAFKNFCA